MKKGVFSPELTSVIGGLADERARRLRHGMQVGEYDPRIIENRHAGRRISRSVENALNTLFSVGDSRRDAMASLHSRNRASCDQFGRDEESQLVVDVNNAVEPEKPELLDEASDE